MCYKLNIKHSAGVARQKLKQNNVSYQMWQNTLFDMTCIIPLVVS